MANQTAADYTKMMQDMMGAMPFDASDMQDSFKNYAAFGEKMSKVVLEAAEKSTELQAKWMKDTLSKMNDMAVAREEPSDYAKAMSDFASAQAEATTETMAAFAEIAKKVQMDTVELMMAAGKDMSEDMTAAAKKATSQASTAAKKTTGAAAK